MKRLDVSILVTGLAFVVGGRIAKEGELAAIGFWLIGQALPKPSEITARAKSWLSQRKLGRRKQVHEPQKAHTKRDQAHLGNLGVTRERVRQSSNDRDKQGNDDDDHAA